MTDMEDNARYEEQESEPWFYCATCLSPNIQHEDALDMDCCGNCGSADIVSSTFEEWEAAYISKYGHKYVQKTEDPRKTFIYNLSLEKLKTRVYKSDKWKEIIHSLYPSFPEGYSRADSVILFFDKLIGQGRLGELRMLLLKMFKF